MEKYYLKDSYTWEHASIVTGVRTIKKKTAVSFNENIFYPGGGGQPYDTGEITIANKVKVSVTRVLKQDNSIWLCLAGNYDLNVGDKITLTIDKRKRYKYMRLHSAAHVLMSIIKTRILNYCPEGISISSDGSACSLSFSGEWSPSHSEAMEIQNDANNIVKKKVNIFSKEYGSLQGAKEDFPLTYRGPKELVGCIRMIVIDGFDANPCGGTHVNNTSEVEKINIINFSPNSLSFEIT